MKCDFEFEFDEHKSSSNKDKHGIDFIEAQELWNDENGAIFDAKSEDENRYALVSRLNDKVWVTIFTMRGEKVRLISVRRARKEEVEFYEQDN
jgi:uncharacterized protein